MTSRCKQPMCQRGLAALADWRRALSRDLARDTINLPRSGGGQAWQIWRIRGGKSRSATKPSRFSNSYWSEDQGYVTSDCVGDLVVARHVLAVIACGRKDAALSHRLSLSGSAAARLR